MTTQIAEVPSLELSDDSVSTITSDSPLNIDSFDPTKLHIINGKLIIPHVYVLKRLKAKMYEFDQIFSKQTISLFEQLSYDGCSITKLKLAEKNIYLLNLEQALLLISLIKGKVTTDAEVEFEGEVSPSKQLSIMAELVNVKFNMIKQLTDYNNMIKNKY